MTGAKAKIKVDLSDWELSDWPDRLGQSVSVETQTICGEVEVTIALKGEIFEREVRRIGKEMIEAFFNTSVDAQLVPEGVKLTSVNVADPESGEFLIPWNNSEPFGLDIAILYYELAQKLAEKLGHECDLMDIPLEEVIGWIASQYRSDRGGTR